MWTEKGHLEFFHHDPWALTQESEHRIMGVQLPSKQARGIPRSAHCSCEALSRADKTPLSFCLADFQLCLLSPLTLTLTAPYYCPNDA